MNEPIPPVSGALPALTQQDLQVPSQQQGSVPVDSVNASELQPSQQSNDLGYKNGVPHITVRPTGHPLIQQPLVRENSAGGNIKGTEGSTPTQPDLQSEFIQHRALAQGNQDKQDWNTLLASGGSGAAIQPPTMTAQEPSTQQLPTPPDPDSSMNNRIQDYLRNTSGWQMTKDIASIPGKVVADVASGAVHSPAQIGGGLLDYVNNLSQFAEDTTKSLHAAGVPDLAVQFTDPKTGQFSPKIMSDEDFEASGGKDMMNGLRIPTAGEPDSVTGHIIRAGTTFLAGMRPFSAAGAGPFLAGIGSGFMGGNDPNQPRLSNLIDSVAPNFVTDFLKAKPEDEGTMLSHLKSGMEMGGFGAAFNGAKKALGYMKQAFPEAATEAATETAQPPVEEKPILPLGNPKADIFGDLDLERHLNTGQRYKEMDDFLNGKVGANPPRINLSRINNSDDVKDALARISTFIKPNAVQSHDATRQLADELGLSPQELLSNYKGQNLDAQQTTAMRTMLNSSAQQLMEYADAVMYPETNSDVAKATFLKAFSVHRALQEYAQNAATQAGRTLNAWGMMSQSTSDYTKAIKGIVESGSMQDIEKLAAGISNAKSAVQAGKIVADASKDTMKDVFQKYMYDSFLSNPITVVKKLSSDALQATWNMAARYYAGNVLPGRSGQVAQGEWAQLGYGYASSFRDGLRLAGQAIKTGQAQFSGENYLDSLSTIRNSAIADTQPATLTEGAPNKSIGSYLSSVINGAKAFGSNFKQGASDIGAAYKNEEGNTIDKIVAGGSKVMDTAPYLHPRNWIVGANEIGEYMHYRGELRALAFRDAMQAGADSKDINFNENIRSVMDNPPSDMQALAKANAASAVFLDPLKGAAASIGKVADQLNIPLPGGYELPFGNIIMPFKKVPLNIAKWAYKNSPLPAVFPSNAINEELAAGGATRDLAIARMHLGSGLALSTMDLALNNIVTGRGPNDPNMNSAWRASLSPDGQDPRYSIRIMGKYYKMAMEPLGMSMGAYADTVNLMRFASPADRDNLAASMMFGFGNALGSRSYLSSVSGFLDAMENPDNRGKRWSDNLIAGFLPGAGGLRDLSAGFDSWQRAHYDLMDTVENNLPFLRNGLPPQQDRWGGDVKMKDAFAFGMPQGISRMISPITIAPAEGSNSIDKEIWRLQPYLSDQNGHLNITRPGQIQSFPAGPHVSAQVELSPESYYNFQKLAGNELKVFNGQGLKDALNDLVDGTSPNHGEQSMWNKASDAEKAIFIQSYITKARQAARLTMIDPSSPNYDLGLATDVKAGWEARAQQFQEQ